MACELCELTDRLDGDGALVPVGRYWTANVRQTAGRPAIVLQVRECRHGLESLDPAEAAEMGTAIQRTAALLERAPGVERVYAQSFNETPGNHVHVHVTPRFRGETDLGPSAAASIAIPEGFDIGEVLALLASGTGRSGQLTARIRSVLGVLTTWPVAGKARHPYSYLRRNLAHSRIGRRLSNYADAGELYVVLALLADIALVALAMAASGSEAPIARALAGTAAVLLVLRALDIASYQFSILLTDEESPLQGHGRTLVLSLANLAELGLVATGTLVALGEPFTAAVAEGARVSTLQNDLTVGGPLATALVTFTMCVALLVAVGTIGIVIGKISETFHRPGL